MKEEKKIVRSFGTHDGTFHADEVTACALLLFFNLIDRNQIVRSRDPKKLGECQFVCDVGGQYDPSHKRFDHHQAEYHDNLSSAGMILKYLKDGQWIDAKKYDFLNRSLVMGIDAIDNGKLTPPLGLCTFSAVIANFVPVLHSADEHEIHQAFFEALDFTLGHLKRLLERYEYMQLCREKVQQAMAAGEEVLVFNEPIPWLELFFELGGETHPALFVIMPMGTHWKLRCIPPSYEERMQMRFPLPEKWAGLQNGKLSEVSKIPGAIFCHKSRFISIWETQEAALSALKYVLQSVVRET